MGIYDEIEIEDMEYEPENSTFFYDCPCGDRFQITMDQLKAGENIAECPSCTLRIRVIFDAEDLDDFSFEAPEAQEVY